MACKEWNNEWVADLYDELDAPGKLRLDRHLKTCAPCRLTLDNLAASRELLRTSAPAVPGSDRVVMIQPRRLARPFWAFAAGLACATFVFAAGLLAGGGQRVFADPRAPQLDPGLVTHAEVEQLLRDQQATLDVRLADFRSDAVAAGPEPETCLTQEEFASKLSRYREEIFYNQERDFGILATQIGAVEQRAATWADENRYALRLAFRSSGVDEH